MKLRLQNNSVRLRLEQHELKRFAKTGCVEATTAFGPGAALTYALETSTEVEAPHARFDGGRLTVRIPTALAEAWAQTDRVGFEAKQPAGDGEKLHLLVEKDFGCRHKSADERDTAQPFAHLRPEAT